VDAGVIVALAFGYVVTAVAALVLYSPIIVLFVVLLLTAGVLQLLVWPLQLLIRKLRRKKKEPPGDQSWLLG
jgi:Flp pilus assembly protein TadB